jgi:hypothetical protein
VTVVLFTLDETAYSRELAPLAGHYPILRLGPAWWFYDSAEGMLRYRRMTTESRRVLQHRWASTTTPGPFYPYRQGMTWPGALIAPTWPSWWL